MLIIHKIEEFYRKFYSLGKKISKRDRFGIYLKIEGVVLEIFELTISAALETKNNKLPLINSARVKVEVLKRIIRTTAELKIIESKDYIELESELQQISKMINGWRNYANK